VASPIALPAAFDGMAQDFPRDSMPKGKAWNMVDYIPQSLGAPLTERGGWAYASPSLAVSDTAATNVLAVTYAPFTGGAQLLAINDTGNLLKVASSATATNVGAVIIPKQNPVFHQNVLVITNSNGTTALKKYDGTTIAALGGTSPAAQYAAVFANRTWLANASAQPQRVYASNAGDATSYDTTNTWLDVSAPVTGLAALPNVLLVFMQDKTARFRGTTPPPQTDMIIDDPIFQYGCTDARSIAVNGSSCCFANGTGVFLTNGTAFPTDLTEAVGMKKYWRDLLATYDPSAWTLGGGWFGNLYVISVMSAGSFVDAIVFDVRKSTAYRVSNLDATAFGAAVQAGQELYAAARGEARLYKLSTMFTPAVAYKADGDGTAVAGVWETPFYDTQKIGTQRWKDVYLEYDLRDAATDVPTMTLGYIDSPEVTSYTSCSPVLAVTTKRKLVRRPVRKHSMGMAFKVTRTNAASQAKIYGIGSTAYPREGSRRN